MRLVASVVDVNGIQLQYELLGSPETCTQLLVCQHGWQVRRCIPQGEHSAVFVPLSADT